MNRKLDRLLSLDQIANKKSILEPAGISQHNAAYFLPGQLDRIVSLEPKTTQQIENVRIHGGALPYPPIEMWEIQNVSLRDGELFTNRWNEKLVSQEYETVANASEPTMQLDEAAFSSSYHGQRYFGHWLIDDAPLAELASRFARSISLPIPPSWQSTYPSMRHCEHYLALISPPTTFLQRAQFRKLYYFMDEGFGPDKAKRLRDIRSRVQHRLGIGYNYDVVYISRGATGVLRLILNELELINELSNRGVHILDLQRDPFEEISRSVAGAKVLISVEGSALTHATYLMKSSGAVLSIMPPDRLTTINKWWTECLDLAYGLTVGIYSSPGQFSVVPSEILRTIDLLLRRPLAERRPVGSEM